jgi:D-alanyl-lipoteichoic acid acyltransferase DltB (MBOAT superfamily)
VFYAVWEPPLLVLLASSIVANYWLGEIAGRGGARKALVATGIVGNLALLGYFKYTAFFIATAGSFFEGGLTVPEVVLPIGISFFTFQQIAYLVDIGRGQHEHVSFMHYALFVAFFPQLIAGPIVYHREVLPQFASPGFGAPSWEGFTVGASVFIAGLAQKVLLADTLAAPADAVFEAAASGQDLLFHEVWGGVLAFTFQIYFDFAGYSNMAIGLAALFGVRLPINFATPYLATSIVDFWRRWHITLSRFLREFLYIPLGGNRKGRVRRYANLLITMLLGGLWHGAGWTFAFWGLLHGTYLAFNHAWNALRERHRRIPAMPPLMAGAVTFLAVVVGWVFFRAGSFSVAWTMLATMAGVGGITLPSSLPFTPDLPGISYDTALVLSLPRTLPLLAVAALFAVLPNVQQMFGAHFPSTDPTPTPGPACARFMSWRPSVRWALLSSAVAALALFLVFVRADPVAFVYFQF